jgi:hypothetical protein
MENKKMFFLKLTFPSSFRKLNGKENISTILIFWQALHNTFLLFTIMIVCKTESHPT